MKGSNQIKRERERETSAGFKETQLRGRFQQTAAPVTTSPPLSLDGEESQEEKITIGINYVSAGSRLDA